MSTSVNIIAHKQVVRLRYFASDFEEFHKIVELSMDITTYDDRSSDWDYVWFFGEDLFGLGRKRVTFSQRALI